MHVQHKNNKIDSIDKWGELVSEFTEMFERQKLKKKISPELMQMYLAIGSDRSFKSAYDDAKIKLCTLPRTGFSSRTGGALPTATTNTWGSNLESGRIASTSDTDPDSFVCFPDVIKITTFGPLRCVFVNTRAASFRALSVLLPFWRWGALLTLLLKSSISI